MLEKSEFYKKLAHAEGLDAADKALFILWFEEISGNKTEMSIGEISDIMKAQGIGNPNNTLLARRLQKKRRTLQGKDGYYLKAFAKTEIKSKAIDILKIILPEVDLESGYLPLQIWENTRGYIEKVCRQINGCYKYKFCDGAAVLIRRLTETLIIECYEHLKREKEIKDTDGNYFMLSDLVDNVLAQNGLTLGRETQKSLRDIKKFGDLSAHNRRYNAIPNDLDKINVGVRVAMEELMNIAELKKSV